MPYIPYLPYIVTIRTIQTIHTVISNIPYPTDLHTIPTICTIPTIHTIHTIPTIHTILSKHAIPDRPYTPYIPNIPYHTPTTPQGGRGTVPQPHQTTGGEGEDLIWGQYMGPIPWGEGGVAGPGAYMVIRSSTNSLGHYGLWGLGPRDSPWGPRWEQRRVKLDWLVLRINQLIIHQLIIFIIYLDVTFIVT